SVSKNLGKLGEAQEQLGTGRKINKPSDDVVLSRMSMSYKIEISSVEQYKRNVNEGTGRLGFMENLINSARDIINRARELAVSESSDTSTVQTRDITSKEINNLYGELLSIGNSKLRNKYLFSGHLTNIQPFDASGNYQGDINDIEVYINQSIKSRINIPGSDAFSDKTKFISDDLTGQTLQGNLRITTGSANPVILSIKDGATSASPEEIRDSVNAPMTGFYTDDTQVVGEGRLTFKVGNEAPVTVDINALSGNDTVSTLVTYINTNITGVKAGIAYEDTGAPSEKARIFLRPTTPGTAFTINVSNDADGNDIDTNGLSALLHNDQRSNLTENALGIHAFVTNGSTGKRLLFSPNVPNTNFTIEVDEANDGSFADAADTDTAAPDGLALLYHIDDTTSNLTDSVTFFTVLDNLKYSLANNDTQGIRESIYLLDGVLDANIQVTADIGSRLKFFEEQKVRLEDSKISYETSLSGIMDADLGDVALRFTKIQSTLESLRISSLEALSQSLFKFLG
ncbi:MAG: flagellar hook-associated protein FlgL, partial [Nitrospirota bacterium]|nr:flagellar hook-associated protein FlgL [Nitrospirota bacterium]